MNIPDGQLNLFTRDYGIKSPTARPGCLEQDHFDGVSHGLAVFSDDQRYRYWLQRVWDRKKPLLAWVMLNPSTADAFKNDQTISRVEQRSMDDGFGGFIVLNLFAFRATDPNNLKLATDPVGPDNHFFIDHVRILAARVVCAWGAHRFATQERESFPLVHRDDLLCLGTTKNGHPRHPLYVRRDQPLVRFKGVFS